MDSINRTVGYSHHSKPEKVQIGKSISTIHQRIMELSAKINSDDIQYQSTETQMKIYHSVTHELKEIRQDIAKIATNKLSLPNREKLSRDLFELNALEEKLNNPKLKNLSISIFMKDQKLENVDENLFQKVGAGIIGIIYDVISKLIFPGSRKDKSINLRYSNELNVLQSQLNQLIDSKNRILEGIGSTLSKKNEAKIVEIDNKMIVITNKIEDLKEENKGKVAREAMKLVGGEAVKIIDQESGNTLDGMYLSADRFREVLKNAGGRIATFEAEGRTTEMLSFPEAKYKLSKIQETLSHLGIDDIDFEIHTMNGNVYFFKREDKTSFLQVGKGTLAFREIDLDKRSDGGTVLLTSCNIGNYEMHKKEMLAYLLRGVNVMGCNFSGYGSSEGAPSAYLVNRNIEAFYQHLKYHHPVEDKKIMLKALCMSGGPATFLAARHPNVNLFLDQTYADFRKAIGDVIESDFTADFLDKIIGEQKDAQSIKQSIRNWCKSQVNTLAHFIGELIAPPWKTEEEIKKIQGNVGLLYTTSDEYFAYEDSVKRNVKSIVKKGLAKNVSVYKMPGEHATSWATLKTRRADLSEERFLKDMSFWSNEWRKTTNSKEENPFEKCKTEFPIELSEYLRDHPEGWEEADDFYVWVNQVAEKWFRDEPFGTKNYNCKEIGLSNLRACLRTFDYHLGCQHMDDFIKSIQIEGNILR